LNSWGGEIVDKVLKSGREIDWELRLSRRGGLNRRESKMVVEIANTLRKKSKEKRRITSDVIRKKAWRIRGQSIGNQRGCFRTDTKILRQEPGNLEKVGQGYYPGRGRGRSRPD